MGRSLRTKLATLFGFLVLSALIAFSWASDDVATAAAAIASVLFGVTVVVFAWWVLDDWHLRREELVDRPPLDHPPSAHRPIEVGRLLLTRGRGDRSGLAATLLMLAHERTIDLDGLDSQRYVLRIPADARGRTDAENEILDEVREGFEVGKQLEIVGPPMPKLDFGARDYRLVADVHERLIADGTLRGRMWGLAAIPALAIVPIVLGSAGVALWIGIPAGVVLGFAMLMAAAGYAHTFTRKGRELRRNWLAYARWLRDHSELESVGAPGVVVWGPHLAYATVMGVAPVAARAFRPKGEPLPTP